MSILVAMNGPTRILKSRWVVVVMVFGLALGACGDDSDPSPTAGDSTGSGDATSDEGDGTEGSAAEDDLLVPRQYLQGEWCDSDGQSWSIEGSTARFGVPGSEATGELPVDLAFINSLDVELVSQTDDEFVFTSGGEEVTFTRGSC